MRMAGEGKKSTQMSEIASQTGGLWLPWPVLLWFWPLPTPAVMPRPLWCQPKHTAAQKLPWPKVNHPGWTGFNQCVSLNRLLRKPHKCWIGSVRGAGGKAALPPKQVPGKPPAQFFQESTTAALQASARTISITMLPLQTQNKLLLGTFQLLVSGGKCLGPIAFTEGCLFSAAFRFCCSNRLLFGVFFCEYCSQHFQLPPFKHNSLSSKQCVPVHSFCIRWYTRHLQCKTSTRT